MNYSRAALSCMMLLTLPLLCSAQSKTPQQFLSLDAVVSVRDLQIPERAAKAFNRGTRLLSAKDWVGSIAEFQRAIKMFPGFYEAYYRMGIAEAELKHGTEAAAAFRTSIELSDDRYAPPHFGLALILSEEKKQFVEAEALARTGLELDPADAGGYVVLGWILYATNRLSEAETMARQAASCQPDLAAAHLLLAEIHRRQSNQSAVVEGLENSFNLNGPSEPQKLIAAPAPPDGSN